MEYEPDRARETEALALEANNEAGRAAAIEGGEILQTVAIRSKTILKRGEELDLFCKDTEGSLPEMLSILVMKTAFVDQDQDINRLHEELIDFVEFYNQPTTQDALPYWGIEVFRDEIGELDLYFAY